MKLELFEKLIRKVIREEVDMAIEKYTKPINEKLNEISSPKTKFLYCPNTVEEGDLPCTLELKRRDPDPSLSAYATLN